MIFSLTITKCVHRVMPAAAGGGADVVWHPGLGANTQSGKDIRNFFLHLSSFGAWSI